MTTSADGPHAAMAFKLLFAGFLAAAGIANAAEEMPDREFLEYLGMWEAADDEWLLLRDEAAPEAGATDETDGGPAPEREESAEKVDE